MIIGPHVINTPRSRCISTTFVCFPQRSELAVVRQSPPHVMYCIGSARLVLYVKTINAPADPGLSRPRSLDNPMLSQTSSAMVVDEVELAPDKHSTREVNVRTLYLRFRCFFSRLTHPALKTPAVAGTTASRSLSHRVARTATVIPSSTHALADRLGHHLLPSRAHKYYH